jgi:molybdopterin-binding protein
MTRNVLTDTFSEPLNGATNAMVVIDAGDGNLTIDHLE